MGAFIILMVANGRLVPGRTHEREIQDLKDSSSEREKIFSRRIEDLRADLLAERAAAAAQIERLLVLHQDQLDKQAEANERERDKLWIAYHTEAEARAKLAAAIEDQVTETARVTLALVESLPKPEVTDGRSSGTPRSR